VREPARHARDQQLHERIREQRQHQSELGLPVRRKAVYRASDERARRGGVGIGRHERLDDGGQNGVLRTVQHGPTFVGVTARCCRSDVPNRGP
jgi:hypothetical protein